MLPSDKRLPRRRRQLNAVRLTPGQSGLLNVTEGTEHNGEVRRLTCVREQR
jgi:hypothetical protein